MAIDGEVKNQIEVTIIVPFYNVEKYLRDCLDSLDRQTLEHIEIIMVNDGSTDDSAKIAKEYLDKNPKFFLIDRENGGLSAARNTGLDAARGEYVYFLDSDDYLAYDAIEKLYVKAREEKLDALRFSAYCFVDGTENYTWQHDNGYKYSCEYNDVYKGLDFLKKSIDNIDLFPSCCLILMRREIIERYRLRFIEGIIHEDNLFNFEYTSLCKRITVLNEPLYYRRIRSGSITQRQDWLNKIRSMCISAEKADMFVENNPEIMGEVSKWHINLFVRTMISYWEQMTVKEQRAKDTREYFDRVKPLIKKYGYTRKSIKLFYMNAQLYRVYRWVRDITDKYTYKN